MSKKVALQTDPTTDGTIIIVPSGQATINGLPIATQGSKLTYKGSPTDQPTEFVSGVLLNNKPLTFVSAKTSAGATILTANQTTATIEPADGAENGEKSEEPKVESENVKLKSIYPYEELQKMSEEVAKSTFYFMMVTFFEKDIPIIAYEELYKLLRKKEEKKLMPEIQVLKSGLSGAKYAAFNKKSRKIEVRESLVIMAVEGNEIEKVQARADLLQGLLEEYGHFLDDFLRNTLSEAHGDALKDEGAVYSYYFTNYHITDENIDFAIAEINGATTKLIIELKEIIQEYEIEKNRIEADYQSKEEEYFTAGKKDVNMKQYGHFDFVSVLQEEGIINEYGVSWIYLGNYMRDMSQVITPAFTELTSKQAAEVDAAHPEIRGLLKHGFFDIAKFTRTTWTNIVEILAAHHTISELRGDTSEALEDKGTDMLEKILNPNQVAEVTSSGQKVKDFMKEKATEWGLKAAQYTLDYYNFIKHYDHIHQKDLGIYRPEEHIDNPIYAAVYDDQTSPKSLYYCPPKKNDKQTNPSIGDFYGMKRHIRNEKAGIEEPVDIVEGSVGLGDYAGGSLPTAVATMKNFYTRGVKKFKNKALNDKQRLHGLTDIGAAMHILEDYFAHTNFCEILLIKHGISVYPWIDVGDPELIDYNKTGKYFKVKKIADSNIQKNQNSKLGDLPESEAITYSVISLYNALSLTGECILLPSFWVDGIYFLYKPNKKDAVQRLYLASANITEQEKNSLIDEVILIGKSTKKKTTQENPDPLNLKCVPERKMEVYAYRKLKCSLADENTLSYRNTKNNENNSYAGQIPIVSGYFSMADTLHSLMGLLDKLFEETKIDFVSVGSTNNMKPVFSTSLQLLDMVILHILTDMKLSQYEEDKNLTDTGKKGSAYILEIYKGLIITREIVAGFAQHLMKKAGLAGIVIYLIDRLINTGYAVLMNLVKSYITDMLHTMNKVIVGYQSMQITTKIGTNPSHSQLAKDETDHPLHSLAGELARFCIREMKSDFGDLVLAKSKVSQETIIKNLIDKSVNFMQHPSKCTWADEIARKWIASNPDRIIELHQHEYEFRKAEKNGKIIKSSLEEMQKLMQEFRSRAAEYMDDIRAAWEDFQKNYQEFIRRANYLKNRVKEKIDEYQREMDESYKELKKYFSAVSVEMSEPEYWICKGQIERSSVKVEENVFRILEALNNQTEKFSPDIAGQQANYAQLQIDRRMYELKNPTLFEQQVFQYCYYDTKDEKYRQYGQKMQDYRDFCLRTLRTEKEYIAKGPDYYLEKLGKTRTISFLQDDNDTGLAMDDSQYKAPQKKGWFG